MITHYTKGLFGSCLIILLRRASVKLIVLVLASMSAYSNKENQTQKALQEQNLARHSPAKCMKLPIPSKGEEQRTPLRTLFADQTPKFVQEQKSASYPSTGTQNSSHKENIKQTLCPLRLYLEILLRRTFLILIFPVFLQEAGIPPLTRIPLTRFSFVLIIHAWFSSCTYINIERDKITSR